MSLFPKFQIGATPLATLATPATQTGESRESRESRNPSPAREKTKLRDLYTEMVNEVPRDVHIIDAWLISAHPALWQEIRNQDDALLRMEREGASESTYGTALSDLLALFQTAIFLRKRQPRTMQAVQ